MAAHAARCSFAYGAGMLATVNPCGFALVPGFLAYYVSGETSARPTPQRLAQALGVGLAVSAGFAAVFTVAGLLVAAGLRSLVGAVPWVAVAIGGVLVLLGLAMFPGRHVGVRVDTGWLSRSGTGVGRMAAFGAAYALSSLPCSSPCSSPWSPRRWQRPRSPGLSPSSSATVQGPGPCSSCWPSRPRS